MASTTDDEATVPAATPAPRTRRPTDPNLYALPRRRKGDGLKRWGIGAGALVATLSAVGMIARFLGWPYETQESADKAHAAINARIDALPDAVADAVVKKLANQSKSSPEE